MNLAWLSYDEEVRDEILGDLASKGLPSTRGVITGKKELQEFVENYTPETPLIGGELEAIVLLFGRPVLLIQNGTFEVPKSKVLCDRLMKAKKNVDRAIAAVGRIEVHNHPRKAWLGTGWLVGPDVIVTNRHIARHFARKEDGKFTFRKVHPQNRVIRANIDFREEYCQPDENEFPVVEVLWVADEDEPDIALCRVSNVSPYGAQLANPIALASEPPSSQDDIVVIGYPAWDGQRNDPIEMERIFRGIYSVKRLAPGKILAVKTGLLTHDATTLGGNSGSSIIDISSGEAVGLHFGGKYDDQNYAAPAAVVRQKLEEYA